MLKKLTLVLTTILTCAFLTVPCMAAREEVNPDTGYYIYIDDEADILSTSEEKLLMQQMEGISEYGHVALITVSNNPYSSTEDYCNYCYDELFGRESGTIFMIDMDNRYIYICNDGYVKRVITNGYSDSITDNVYTYATDGDYYLCASEAFSQIEILLEGGRISQPMKYICNALLSLIIGCTITYFIVKIVHSKRAPKTNDVLEAIFAKTNRRWRRWRRWWPQRWWTQLLKQFTP